MSSQIALNKTSGGQMIITPEDGTTTETITIPSVGVGKVLQTVTNSIPDAVGVSGTGTLVSTGLSVTITPSDSTHRLIVTLTASIQYDGTTPGDYHLYLVRNDGSGEYNAINGGAKPTVANNAYREQWLYNYTGESKNEVRNVSPTWNGVANVTTPVTFTIYLGNVTGTAITYMNRFSAPAQLTVMEVAA